MLAWELWAAFFGYAIPMVISPGPGNTLLATAGGRFGIRGSVPFWLGFEAANLVLCLIYGLGLGRVLHDYPAIELALKWVGVLYLLYLAKGFLMPSAKGAAEARDTSRLGFGAGFFCVMVNPKIHSMIVVMFAQFLKPGASMATQAALLTTGFMLVGATSPGLRAARWCCSASAHRGRCAFRGGSSGCACSRWRRMSPSPEGDAIGRHALHRPCARGTGLPTRGPCR